jgi:hypothetical protein
MIPDIQLAENSENIKLFWDPVSNPPDVKYFNIYWSLTKDAPYTLFDTYISNYASFADRYVGKSFTRSSLGLQENQPFYLKISSVNELNIVLETSNPRRIPAVLDEPPTVNSTEVAYSQEHGWDPISNTWRRLNTYAKRDGSSELVVSSGIAHQEVKSQIVGQVSVPITFTHDVRVVEIYNYSESARIFVNTKGSPADASLHIPVMPMSYYVFETNPLIEEGISIVSNTPNTDVRIIGHYSA